MMRTEDKTRMTEGSISRKIILFAIPLFLGNLFQVKKDCLYQLLFTIRQQRQGGFQPVHHDRIDNGFCNVHRFISDKVQRIPLAVRKSVER